MKYIKLFQTIADKQAEELDYPNTNYVVENHKASVEAEAPPVPVVSGYFLTGANPATGVRYNFRYPVELALDSANNYYTGITNSAVSTLMLSTQKGNETAFKSNTLKPDYVGDYNEGDWAPYSPQANYEITLPSTAVWKIYWDTEYTSVAFEAIQ